MATHTITGFITYERQPWQKEGRVSFQLYEPHAEYQALMVIVAPHSFSVEVPDNFDPIPMQVAALNEKKRLERLKLAKKLAEIDETISKLTSLEYVPPPTGHDSEFPF